MSLHLPRTQLTLEQTMAVRIFKGVISGVTVLRIDGWLRTEDVAVLKTEFQNVRGPVALELSQLQSADTVGVASLLETVSLGAELQGASGYIELLLSQNGWEPKDGKQL